MGARWGAAVLLFAATHACARTDQARSAAREADATLTLTPTPAPMPGPDRRRLGKAAAANDACVGCHPVPAEAWRGSLHQRSATNAAFLASLVVEQGGAFCLGCHAPESDPRRAAPTGIAELGVACVTCHVTEDGSVLAAPDSGPHAPAPHALRRTVAFAQSGACAGCHEFRFPGPASYDDDDGRFMQTTLREHHRVAPAGSACADCHMPRESGGRSHAFSQVRDAAWLRVALTASAERVGDRVRIHLAQRAPGHAFPTGDLFRRIEVGCEARDPGGKVVGRDVRHLARQLVMRPGTWRRELVGDNRVFEEPVVVELDPHAPLARGDVTWWVTLQRVATAGDGLDRSSVEVESEVRIHSGALP